MERKVVYIASWREEDKKEMKSDFNLFSAIESTLCKISQREDSGQKARRLTLTSSVKGSGSTDGRCYVCATYY